MAEQDEPLREKRERGWQLPPVGVGVWVECDGRKVMAYRDGKGVWRNADNGEELKGAVKVEWPPRWPEPGW